MRRREFIAVLGGAAALPLAAQAQQTEHIRRMGAMVAGTGADDTQAAPWMGALRQGLQELGWNELPQLRVEYRWPAGDLDRARTIAKELVGFKPDVIFAGNTPSVAFLLQETRTIPIVFANLSDPVGSGLVAEFVASRRQRDGFRCVRIFAWQQVARSC